MTLLSLYAILVLSVAILAALGVHAACVYKRAIDLNPAKIEKQELLARIATLHDELNQCEGRLRELRQEQEAAKQVIDKAVAERKWLEDNEPKLQNSKAQLATESARLEEVAGKRAQQQQLLDEAAKELQGRKNDLAAIEIQLTEQSGRKSQLEADLRSIQGQIAVNRKQDAEAREKLQRAQNELLEQEARQRQLKTQFEHDQAECERQLRALRGDCERKSNELQAQLATESARLEEVIGKCVQQQQLLDEVAKELQSRKKDLAAIEIQLTEQSGRKSQLEADLRSIQGQIAVNRKQDAEAREKLQRAQNELLEQEARQRQLKTQFEHDQAECERQLRALRGDCERKSNELQAQLAQKQSELAARLEELAAAKQEYKSISKRNLGLEERNSELERLIIRRRPEANQWGDLERPVIQSGGKVRLKPNAMAEPEWLEDFQDKLRKHGIVFSERMIYAFHTGMKVADLSPLVVLAGISGTGKSLLPQLYAHAIGMNFVQLAVQPRWDSPQDMLGFYNYTENRFKATELSRLLWQYDRWNNPKNAPRDDESTPMNLVLLDEMNLARVEYYFSDLLSKLEVRRTINPDDPDSRRAAEIEIECGATGDNAQTRRLFVAPNTLFVGTMNEDESTQTLSDKVMDRANVLRFGCPKSLDTKPNAGDFMAEYDPGRRLTLKQWRSQWLKGDGVANASHRIGNQPLVEYMEEINNAMATIDRPFAHRVWQAIDLYVANYPDESPAGVRHAVADQIELKILPKLNGVQKQQNSVARALNALQNQIDRLQDTELSAAFKMAADSSDIFFKWQGVKR